MVPFKLVFVSLTSMPSEPAAGASCVFAAFEASVSSVVCISSWFGFLQATKRLVEFWVQCVKSHVNVSRTSRKSGRSTCGGLCQPHCGEVGTGSRVRHLASGTNERQNPCCRLGGVLKELMLLWNNIDTRRIQLETGVEWTKSAILAHSASWNAQVEHTECEEFVSNTVQWTKSTQK